MPRLLHVTDDTVRDDEEDEILLWEGVSRHSAQPRAPGCPSPPSFPTHPNPSDPRGGRRRFSQSCCQIEGTSLHARALQAYHNRKHRLLSLFLCLSQLRRVRAPDSRPGSDSGYTVGLWATDSTGCASVSSSAEWEFPHLSKRPHQPRGSSLVIDSCTPAERGPRLLGKMPSGLWTLRQACPSLLYLHMNTCDPGHPPSAQRTL